MAINLVIAIVLLPLLSFLLYFCKCRRNALLTDWPLVGMMPGLFMNVHDIHNFAAYVLQRSNLTFQFKGPSLANLNLLCTCDPANINYILSKNFTNYPKGPEFAKIFDILGDGIFSAEGHIWEVSRSTTMTIFTHAKFHHTVLEAARQKLEIGLVPLFDHASKHGIELDLLDIFQRLNFDNICSLLLDHDPQTLSVDLPYHFFHRGLMDVQEALMYRHILPESIWKLQSLMGFGKEKKYSKAWKKIDEFMYRCISLKRQQVASKVSEHMSVADEDDKLDIAAAFLKFADKEKPENPDKLMRDTMLSLILGGRDSSSAGLAWFFWLLSKNPLAESKILEEINKNLQPKEVKSLVPFNNREDLQKLVYLHGALCEALRLYPSIPFNHKSPTQPDILPSGHRVEKDSKIVLSFYAMARMESIWGKDCLEFKPERWLNKQGGILSEPSYKFTAFNSGPRLCVGKDMALTQMKIFAATIIHGYSIKVVEDHPIVQSDSIILDMKYGLKVTVAKRSACLAASAE
ncbi:hypothetical protein DCAR_0310037 [Daucus carota subsp. sativus]|uniref:Alkane hydroxylase MAH1-like n=1 Tax=Daucus carota subsp. sativus TaxID=79200 RepID=A0AAF0WJP7_DAUCS|nr:PREDICTED: alkane hydroxylase MAH1-like [Daucus carota subsp. sativus]WOG90792.1 hypothetical protein DCAR_0310037 [Daucus carota subsp. sativus]